MLGALGLNRDFLLNPFSGSHEQVPHGATYLHILASGIQCSKRFRRWVKVDAFYRIFKTLTGDHDFEYAMVDGTIVRMHRHGQGAKGGLKARPSESPAEA